MNWELDAGITVAEFDEPITELRISKGLVVTKWEEDGETRYGVFRAEDLELIIKH